MISGLLLTPVLLRLTFASQFSVSTSKFVRCYDNDLYVGPVLDAVVVRSTSHCAGVCSRNDRCHVISVCPRNGSLGQVDFDCNLFDEGALQPGNSNGTPPGCFQLERVRPEALLEATTTTTVATTEQLQCQNGGTLVNGRCQCTRQYGGTACERLIRDCTEPYENGYRTNYQGTALLVQPVGSPVAFWIVCVLDYGGLGYVLLRNSPMTSFNVNWATAKTGIVDTSLVMSFSSNYFIGLENLHHMLSQADYMANVYCQYSFTDKGWVYYNKFTVGPENSSYALSYQSTFRYQADYLDDGFNSQGPIPFSTIDHDPNSCHKGYPGWFSSSCTGYSPFADLVTWPVNGVAKSMYYVNIGVTRKSNFTVN